MVQIARTRPWAKQPQIAVGINKTNPITNGLVLAVLPHSDVNIVTGQRSLNTPTGLTRSGLATGISTQFPGASGGYLSYTLQVGGGDMTGFCIVNTASTASQTFLGAFPSGGGSLGNYLDCESGHFTSVSTSGANWTLAASSLSQTTNADVRVGARFFSGAGRDIWENGILTGTDSTVRTVTGLDRIIIGAYYASGFDQVQMAGAVYLSLWWNRALSPEEMRSISDNPWQVFAPLRRFLWIPSAGGNVSVTLSGASLTGNLGTLSSAISTLLSGSSLTGSTGTVVNAISQGLSGQALTTSTGTIKSAISYTLTGNSATISTGTLTASTGGAVSVNLSGSNLTISSGTVKSAISTALSTSLGTFATGTIVNTVGPTLTGISTTASAGTLVPAIARALSGTSLTVSQGTLSALTGSTITVKAGSWIRYRVI